MTTDPTHTDLINAHAQARLRGTVEEAMADPTIAKCLRNIVASNQADPHRHYDLATDGETVFITPLPKPVRTFTINPDLAIDFKKRASGDDL